MSLVLAHGIGGVQDLPVPLWLFYYGGAAVLVASFLGLAFLWRRPVLERSGEREPPERVSAVVLSRATRIVAGSVGLGLLVAVEASALVGTQEPGRNLAPTFVYVDFWVGLPILTVLLGNVWRWLDPWRAAADAVAWTARRAGIPTEAAFVYPERLGRYPAAALLACFTILELAYWDPSSPRTLAAAILLYSAVAWLGMLSFGREAWRRNCDGFAVYLGLLSGIAPFAARAGRLVVRPPLAGLTRLDALRPGTLAVVAVLLGSTAFDGLSRTRFWQDRLYELQSRWIDTPRAADLVGTLANTAALLVVVAAVAATFAGAVRLGGLSRELSPRAAFLPSLVPIAFAYVVAHYFSLLVLQGQATVGLVSDPLGRGWDLLGTADYRLDLTLLAPRLVWYVQVTALVVGHVLGLALAHDRALVVAGTMRRALRSQYAMLALMVLYTVGGMWILSRP